MGDRLGIPGVVGFLKSNFILILFANHILLLYAYTHIFVFILLIFKTVILLQFSMRFYMIPFIRYQATLNRAKTRGVCLYIFTSLG